MKGWRCTLRLSAVPEDFSNLRPVGRVLKTGRFVLKLGGSVLESGGCFLKIGGFVLECGAMRQRTSTASGVSAGEPVVENRGDFLEIFLDVDADGIALGVPDINRDSVFQHSELFETFNLLEG